jgi:hypothetical protein
MPQAQSERQAGYDFALPRSLDARSGIEAAIG